MPKTLTAEEVRALLARAVEEKGDDYTYDLGPEGECDYFRNGTPSCIVGHVFSYLGYTAPDLDPAEGLYARRAIELLHLRLPTEAIAGLQDAQREQDLGGTWGRALAVFDKAVSNA